jgi:hypothetical protein
MVGLCSHVTEIAAVAFVKFPHLLISCQVQWGDLTLNSISHNHPADFAAGV